MAGRASVFPGMLRRSLPSVLGSLIALSVDFSLHPFFPLNLTSLIGAHGSRVRFLSVLA